MADNRRLHEAAMQAMHGAIATYSNFKVGAALLTEAGAIYSGCNIEISSYGLTICAERVAIFKALSEGERHFKSIVVTSQAADFCPPCGACRQVLMDFAPDLEVILLRPDGKVMKRTIDKLLPDAFGRSHLENLK